MRITSSLSLPSVSLAARHVTQNLLESARYNRLPHAMTATDFDSIKVCNMY
jgi:hypothetical protein